MELEFEWDPQKAVANARKHGVTFSEASTSTAFRDPLSVTVPDPRHSRGDEGFVLFGRSERDRLLAVMHTERGLRICLISARPVTPRERTEYAEED